MTLKIRHGNGVLIVSKVLPDKVQHTGRLSVLLVQLPLKGQPSMRENRRRRAVVVY